MQRILFLVALLFISPILSTSSIISNAFKTTQTGGQGTYYGATTGGACGFQNYYPSFASSLTKVALSTAMYQGNDGISGGCGVCISMQGTGTGSGANPISKTAFTVFVHDECPGCPTPSIDLSTSGDGSWGITWKAVPCPVGSEKLKYKFQGSNQYYLKMQVVSHKLPLSRVDYVIGGKTYTATHSSDNFWISPSGMPQPTWPMTVNVYSTDGEMLTDTVPSLTNGGLLAGGKNVQFSGSAGLTADESTTTTADDVNGSVMIAIAVGCLIAVVLIVVIIVIIVRGSRKVEEIV